MAWLFPGIGLMAIVFLPWDIPSTVRGVRDFNDRYLLGPRIAGMPLEERLFFPTVPYACPFLRDDEPLPGQ